MCLDRPHHWLGSWVWALEVGGFSRSGCHRLWARMPIQFRNQQAERRSSGDHGSIWDSWPIAFSGYPREGLEYDMRLDARGTQRLTALLRLALEPKCLENPTASLEKIPAMEWTRSETLKLFVVSDDWRRSTLLSSTRLEQWWQFFWLRSVAPFPAACLSPLKPHKSLGTGRAWSRR